MSACKFKHISLFFDKATVDGRTIIQIVGINDAGSRPKTIYIQTIQESPSKALQKSMSQTALGPQTVSTPRPCRKCSFCKDGEPVLACAMFWRNGFHQFEGKKYIGIIKSTRPSKYQRSHHMISYMKFGMTQYD